MVIIVTLIKGAKNIVIDGCCLKPNWGSNGCPFIIIITRKIYLKYSEADPMEDISLKYIRPYFLTLPSILINSVS